MKRLILAVLVCWVGSGCTSNRGSDEPGARIRDTTLTAQDTVNPGDTLPRIRDSVSDSVSR